MIASYLLAFVNAVLAMVVTFGLNLSTNEIGSIMAVTNAGLVLATAIVGWYTNRKKSQITPPSIAAPRSNL